MRITFILSSLILSGGVRDIVEIVNRLANDNHKICLIIPGNTRDDDINKEIAPTVMIKESKFSGVGKLSLFQMIRLSIDLALLVPKSDFIISTQTPTTVSTLIGSVFLGKGKPIWFYQDYLEMFLDRPIISWLLKRALIWHQSAIVLSQYSKEELEKYVHGKKIVVCSVGLSHSEYYHPSEEIDRNKGKGDKKYILTLGDMRPRKGWDDFWQAMELVVQKRSDIEVWFVSKEACVFSTQIPYKYIYRPQRKELAHLYSVCDVFVSASWWESFGIPPLEAMACGAPVVMTDSRGGRDYSFHNQNCLLVPPKEPDLLAEAILLILRDHELETKLRKNGPIIAATFTWEASYNKFLRELERIYNDSKNRKLIQHF